MFLRKKVNNYQFLLISFYGYGRLSEHPLSFCFKTELLMIAYTQLLR